MWFGVVGSHQILCDCPSQNSSWPQSDISHPEDCFLLETWLLVLKSVTKLASRPGFEGIVSGGAPGIDTMAKDAAMLIGVPCREFLPEGRGTFWERASRRNQKIVDKVAKSGGEIIALFKPGPRTPGTSDTISRAIGAKVPVHIHEQQEGVWHWVTE